MVHWREFFDRSPSPESDEQKDKKQELHPQQQGSADALRGLVAHSGQPGAATTGAGTVFAYANAREPWLMVLQVFWEAPTRSSRRANMDGCASSFQR